MQVASNTCSVHGCRAAPAPTPSTIIVTISNYVLREIAQFHTIVRMNNILVHATANDPKARLEISLSPRSLLKFEDASRQLVLIYFRLLFYFHSHGAGDPLLFRFVKHKFLLYDLSLLCYHLDETPHIFPNTSTAAKSRYGPTRALQIFIRPRSTDKRTTLYVHYKKKSS